jgi:hypothetical protein
MVSKREKKKWKKYVESQAFILDVHLARLMYEELKFDAKVRKKALKMARKRSPQDYIS